MLRIFSKWGIFSTIAYSMLSGSYVVMLQTGNTFWMLDILFCKLPTSSVLFACCYLINLNFLSVHQKIEYKNFWCCNITFIFSCHFQKHKFNYWRNCGHIRLQLLSTSSAWVALDPNATHYKNNSHYDGRNESLWRRNDSFCPAVPLTREKENAMEYSITN